MSSPRQPNGEPVLSPAEHPYTELSRPRLTVLAVGLVVGSAVILVLATLLVPAPGTFSFSITVNSGQFREQSMIFPNGSIVSGNWASSNPDARVVFSIATVLPGNVSDLVYQSRNSNSGSFSFRAAGTTYDFTAEAYYAATTVQVSGSY